MKTAKKKDTLENQYNQGLLSIKEFDKKKSQFIAQNEVTENKYVELIIELLQMTFRGKMSGFEVKNTASGKLKIIVK